MSKSKKILLVYFDSRCSYVPLDLGYAMAYLLKHEPGAQVLITSLRDPSEKYRGKRALTDFENDAERIANFQADSIVFFLDNIVWSGVFYEYLALNIAPRIKKLQPKVQIGLQSYKIRNERSEEILENNSAIDFILRGEAEIPLLEFYRQSNKKDVPGLTFRRGNKKIVVNSDPELIANLAAIPSPYLTGIFDNFIEQQLSFGRSQFFLTTSRGCPYRCHYCFRSVRFSRVRNFPIKRVVDEIDYLKKRGVKNIFMLDDTFMPSKNRLREFTKKYKEKFSKKSEKISLIVMTRPELVDDDETVLMYSEIGVKRVQIGIQSINSVVQHLITRSSNFDFDIFRRISKYFHKYKISLMVDTIFGLPGDDLFFFKKTVEFAISLKPHSMQIKHLYLNPDTLFYNYPERYGIEFPKEIFNRHTSYVYKSKGWEPADLEEAFVFAAKIFDRYGKKISMKIISSYGRRDSRGDGRY